MSFIVPHLVSGVVSFLCCSDGLLSAHPYEEPSYGVYALLDF